MDRLSRARRSWNMSRIRGKDTGPERAVRSILHRMGYRFRLHPTALPGRPDIVLPRYNTVVLVHGCFWHRHSNCRFAYTPKTRVRFWRTKLEGNAERDRRSKTKLERAGWHVITVWECELRHSEQLARRLHARLQKHARPALGNGE